MPNWVYNTLTIEAKPQVIAKVKAQLSAPYQYKYDDTGITDVQKDLSFWNIIRPPADKMDEYHTTHGFANGERQGDTEFNWYNWNISNWGVKWDARECELVEEDETSLQYRFDTPWGVAEGAMIALSQQYPEVEFNLSFEEETGWGGELIFTNGSSVLVNEYAQKCYACDTQFTNEDEYWNEYDEEEHQHKCQANGYEENKTEPTINDLVKSEEEKNNG